MQCDGPSAAVADVAEHVAALFVGIPVAVETAANCPSVQPRCGRCFQQEQSGVIGEEHSGPWMQSCWPKSGLHGNCKYEGKIHKGKIDQYAIYYQKLHRKSQG